MKAVVLTGGNGPRKHEGIVSVFSLSTEKGKKIREPFKGAVEGGLWIATKPHVNSLKQV